VLFVLRIVGGLIMSFNIGGVLGALTLGIVGGVAGAAAGLNIGMNVGLTNLSVIGILILVGSIVGAAGGLGVSMTTLWSIERFFGFVLRGSQNIPSAGQDDGLLARLGIAQVSWALIAIGISFPYLAVVLFTVFHWSQAGTVKLDGTILSHVAGLVGALFWIDGVVLQILTVYPALRSLVKIALSLP
jgi:hypothetical protein